MLVVEVDVIGRQAFERALTRAPDVLGASIDAPIAGVLSVDREPELGCDLELVPAPGDGTPHELLVRIGAVDLGGVEEADSKLERAIDRLQARRLITAAVGVGHPHAPQSLRGYVKSLAA